ncbi:MULTISPECIES: hypothetical protein [unclassified Burkholderia]|uniref:hypothetical protein n=1 Tax=unclassified Burkholderia TaxID=2613784 RepID=UPI0019662AE7|nr:MULTISPECIES: hypothetical protein [unclassified Burkholderia]
MMGSLINLPGVAGKIDNVPFCNSPAHAIRLLREHRACTGAGAHGAVLVYRADDGTWNCIFNRHLITLEHSVHDTKKAIREWLDAWYPKVNGGDAW